MAELRTYPQKARERITGSKVLTRLIAHVEGTCELTNSQVNAAKALLNKVLPDVRTTELKGNVQINHTERLTDEQLMAIAARGLKRKAIDGEAERVQEPLKLGSKSNGAG